MSALELACGLARRFEGLHLRAYYCPVGYPTQGWGRLLTRDMAAPLDRFPDISRETADGWLLDDMSMKLASVDRMICPCTDGERAALADFAFNLGTAALARSTLYQLARRGDREGAADQFKLWVYGGGRKLAGLVARRAAERQLWLSS